MYKLLISIFIAMLLIGCDKEKDVQVNVYDVYKIEGEQKLQTSVFVLSKDFFSLINGAATIGERGINYTIKESNGRKNLLIYGKEGRLIDSFIMDGENFYAEIMKNTPEGEPEEVAFKILYEKRK